MKLILCLVLVALTASKATIPDLYNQNKGVFTSDYSVTYNGPVPTEYFGVTSEAGDINNDGISDFMVSNPSFDNGKGIVYVIYGKPGSLRQFNSMDDFKPSDGFIIKGNAAGQNLGFSVNAAGDVNGDGIDDIVIGSAYWSQDYDVTEAGMAYVLFGRKSSSEFPSTVDVDCLSSAQGFRIFGANSMEYAGFSVSGAGDVNGDGISDVIVGAFGANDGAGNAYIIFGSKKGLGDMKLPPAAGKGFTVEGSNQENLGATVSKAGDFNGDGVDDLIIGAHCADGWTGRAYIIFGRKGAYPATIYANDGLVLQGVNYGDNFGCAVSGAGDFNGDGLQDVIIGAYGVNGDQGAAYVILGSRNNPSTLNMNGLSSSRGFKVMSSAYSQLGLQVSGGRDLNGDGLSDITVSAPGLDNGKGAAYVLYGSQGSSFSGINLDNLKSKQGYMLAGAEEGDRFGHFSRPVKDVNNDGVDDLFIGAFGANCGKGAAYLFYLPWKCMDTCSQCSKPDTCEVCAEGLGFLDNKCVACPSTTHILKSGSCQERCKRKLFTMF